MNGFLYHTLFAGGVLEAVEAFNSIEWILAPVDVHLHVAAGSRLSIPLNGFDLLLTKDNTLVVDPFNSIEWIHSSHVNFMKVNVIDSDFQFH